MLTSGGHCGEVGGMHPELPPIHFLFKITIFIERFLESARFQMILFFEKTIRCLKWKEQAPMYLLCNLPFENLRDFITRNRPKVISYGMNGLVI